jgi:hypothetical protein
MEVPDTGFTPLRGYPLASRVPRRRFEMTKKSILRAVLAVAGALLLNPPALSGELAGVKMPDTMTAGGKALKLNGMGLRKKAIFKVYVGGLYVETPSKDAAAIVAADAPKAMKMHFVRNVDKAKLVEGYSEGFEANAKAKAAAQKANVDRFYGFLSDVKDGSDLTFTYVPGTGTVVSKDGKDVGTIEGKDFAEALFSVWLGPKPPTEDLKKGLLGS